MVIILQCPIIQECPRAVPIPVRAWDKDGLFVYVGLAGVEHNFREEFLEANPLLMPGVVFPPPLDIGSSSGSLRLSTLASNLSMPMFAPPGVDQSNVRDEVFNELLGTYTCIVENEYGTDQAVTTISECDGGKIPTLMCTSILTS